MSRSQKPRCSLNSAAFDTSTLNPLVTMIALFEQSLNGSVISVVVKSSALQTSCRKPRRRPKWSTPVGSNLRLEYRFQLRGRQSTHYGSQVPE